MRPVILAAFCLGLAPPALAQPPERHLVGTLALPAGVTLPSEAAVTVRAGGKFGTTLGEAEMTTAEAGAAARPTLGFDIEVPRDLGGRLRAEVSVAGMPRWVAADVPFAAGAHKVDFGAVPLRAAEPLDFAATLVCGDRRARFGMLGDSAALRIDGREIALARAVSASGARYVGADDAGVEVFTKGRHAMVTLGDEQLPECAFAPPPELARYGARGTGGDWSVEFEGDAARLVTDGGTRHETLERPEARPVPGAYRFDMPRASARLTVREGPCHGDGVPRPDHADLGIGGHTLPGCGGDPADLLTGAEWRIEDVEGMGIVDGSHIMIAFGEDGRVAGTTGCNRYFGSYDVGRDGLSLGRLGSTMMACPEALMTQERRVLDALERVENFDIDATGALLLIGDSGDTRLLARRP